MLGGQEGRDGARQGAGARHPPAGEMRKQVLLYLNRVSFQFCYQFLFASWDESS